MRSYFALLVSVAALASLHALAHAQAPERFRFTAQCLTDGTNDNGTGNDCNSIEQCFDAPAGFVINKDTVAASLIGQNGRNNACRVSYKNDVEIIAGSNIKLPRTVCVQAHALSPGGMFNRGARGWSDCIYTGEYVKVK